MVLRHFIQILLEKLGNSAPDSEFLRKAPLPLLKEICRTGRLPVDKTGGKTSACSIKNDFVNAILNVSVALGVSVGSHILASVSWPAS